MNLTITEKPYEFSSNIQIEHEYKANYKVTIEGISADEQFTIFSLLASRALDQLKKESINNS